ncbi:uncharacterized protein EI97DRAFT_433867 [Westerdykella ornata]|uniref:CENP-T/Histone H4 histone fold domain-containing protein n=1 Tax=Westerdykella ornata TaxID=318751 RepID=A0A6A6JIA1_WESOR|nr:uncharacterized protein EI97DRAFT_433867 [Westerdykella ornata]KAF2275934.1 hypothetical protein EI97DRAFT_433867 [Westerdykella ornata]
MSESARKKQRVSPNDSNHADHTLHSDLRHLSNLIPKPVTPFRRAISASAATPATHRTPNNIPIRTPGTAARTPRGATSLRAAGQGRRAAPTTPHAIRALRERANAARTPGRRRSGRVQRETPRDILRALSRTLAKDTVPADPSPEVPSRSSALDLADVDDGPDPVRPRLSMPLDDMYDDDSIHEPPPRESLLPDLPDDVDTGTLQSLEFGRRAYSEDPRAQFTARLSERFGDLNELGLDGEEFEVDGMFINRRRTLDPDRLLQEAIEEALDEDAQDVSGLGGLGLGQGEEVDEPTFRFTIPARIRREEREDQPPLDNHEDLENQNENEDEGSDEAGADAQLTLHNEDHEDEDIIEPLNNNTDWESDQDAQPEDPSLVAYREEPSAIDRSLLAHSPSPHPNAPQNRRQRKALHISRSGHEYPSFPAAVVKRIATGMVAKSQGTGKGKINKETLAVLVQTTDWFFEQVSEDLAAYAGHAGRKVVEEQDVVCLMKRQRQISANTTAFSLAQKMLPRELLQELRMQPVSAKGRRQKRKRMEAIQEEEDEDG